jgi:hypothetical protein
MPALAISLARADAGGPPMFATVEMTPVANNTVSNEEIWRFTGDQVAGALLLDIPEVFHLKFSALEPNTQNFLFPLLIVIYRTVIGFGLLLSIVATMRMRALWRYAMEVAMPVRDIVAMEPALAAGRGHEEYRHSREEPRWHQQHHEVREPEPVPQEKPVHYQEAAAEPEHRQEVEAEHLRQEAHRHEVLAEEAHLTAEHGNAEYRHDDAVKHHNDDVKAAE